MQSEHVHLLEDSEGFICWIFGFTPGCNFEDVPVSNFCCKDATLDILLVAALDCKLRVLFGAKVSKVGLAALTGGRTILFRLPANVLVELLMAETIGLDTITFCVAVWSTDELGADIEESGTDFPVLAGLMTSGDEVSAEEEQLETTSGLVLAKVGFSFTAGFFERSCGFWDAGGGVGAEEALQTGDAFDLENVLASGPLDLADPP